MRKAVILLASIASLAAASAVAAPIGTDDAARVATLTVNELRPKLPPAASVVVIVPMSAKGREDAFAPALEGAMRSAGYAVAADAASAREAQVVRYGVLPAWDGYVVQLVVDGEASTRLYRPDRAGALVSAGPATVRVEE